MEKKRFCVDIDDTITYWNDNRDYENFEANTEMVRMINSLYDLGHHITLFTARGMTSVGPDKITSEIVPALISNLKKHGLKYHELITHKPSYDFIIDDKALTPNMFKKLYGSDMLGLHKPDKVRDL